MLKNRSTSSSLPGNILAVTVQDCMSFACLLAVESKEIMYEIKKALGKQRFHLN